MLRKTIPLSVKFICAFIYSQEKTCKKTVSILENKYGEVDFESDKIDFDHTNYYLKEMGEPLFRKFVSFRKLQKAQNFVKIKLFCIKIEKKFAIEGARTINIDPGYLDEARLALITTKDFSHRIYLNKGIYAEITLYYQNGKFCDFPATFPDYRTNKYKDIFETIRSIYSGQIKK